MKKLLVATIPNMIEKKDTYKLSKFCKIDWIIKDRISEEELASVAKDYDYLMLNFDIIENLTERFYNIVKNSNLKVISTDITGMDWAKPKLAKESGIYLLNTTNYCTESVAEYAITQILLYAKQFHLTYKDIANGEKPKARKTINLLDKTMGIVGLGNIGTRVAEIASAMGMKVVGYNHNSKQIENVKMVDLKTLFKQSDFISLHLKTVPGKTEEIITKELLKLCKPTCFIENQADYKLINQADLIWALENKIIAGYGATLNEGSQGLENFENVILSPANAWNSDESMENLKNIWINNIIEFEKGNIVNLVEE